MKHLCKLLVLLSLTSPLSPLAALASDWEVPADFLPQGTDLITQEDSVGATANSCENGLPASRSGTGAAQMVQMLLDEARRLIPVSCGTTVIEKVVPENMDGAYKEDAEGCHSFGWLVTWTGVAERAAAVIPQKVGPLSFSCAKPRGSDKPAECTDLKARKFKRVLKNFRLDFADPKRPTCTMWVRGKWTITGTMNVGKCGN